MITTWDLGKDVTYDILIANLGGYEKAKLEFEARKRSGIHACELERGLLQYRREHGIFEAGDKVVFKNNWTANNLVLTIGGDGNSIRMDTVLNLSSHFRHATDAEIKANKRLESSL